MDMIAMMLHWIYFWLISRTVLLEKRTFSTEKDKCYYHHYTLSKLQTNKLRMCELYGKEQRELLTELGLLTPTLCFSHWTLLNEG